MGAVLAAFERHLASERGLSPHTVRAYIGDIASLLGYAADDGCEALADIDIGVLRGWLGTLHRCWPGADHDRPAGRVGASVHCVRASARLAGRRSGRPASHAEGSPPPAGGPRAGADDEPFSPARLPARPEAGARQAADALSAALELRDAAIMELLYATGIRVSELCGLDAGDLDLARRTVRVLGKRSKERVVPVGIPAVAVADAGSVARAAGRRPP